MPRARLFAEWIAILVLTLAVAAWAHYSGVTARLDNAVLDRAMVSASAPADGGVVIVAIDERSLAEGGRWPWNRGTVAGLIDRTAAASPKAILLDVIYAEPAEAEADAALADALRRSGKVALPVALGPPSNRAEGFDIVPPIAQLAEQALVTGHVGIEPDADGRVRRMTPRVSDPAGQAGIDHLIAGLHQKLSGKAVAAGSGWHAGSAMRLRPAGSYRTVSASAVLKGEVPQAFLGGKLVIIGATAQGLGDNLAVPAAAGSMMSGVELLANGYQNIAQDSFITAAPTSIVLALTAAIIGSLFAAFWLFRPLVCVMVAIASCALALAGSYGAAAWGGVWIPPGPAMAGLIIAYPLWGWRRLSTINAYLLRKADGLATAEGEVEIDHSGGFDTVARSVNRLDFLVDELAERRAFLRRVIEATPDALCVFDRHGSLIMMNQRARALTGRPPAETEGLGVKQLLDTVNGRLEAEGRELHLDDGRIFVVTRSTGLADAHWPEIHLAMFTDVTAQRLAEAERRQALEFLSHDMRAPQVAIMGLTKDHELGEGDRLERIRTHARRTMELADNFVELARLAERPLDIDEHELVSICEEAADRAFALARDYGAKVRVEGPDDPVFLNIDGQVISRVLDNLIGNAIKYGATRVAVTVNADRNPASITITIADNGPGMPEERLANPFARFGVRSRAKTKGAGLGLAFVKAAVEHHGGRVDCLSSPDGGTTFLLEFPPVSAA
ncbi:MAG: CHASE2 domain-containing protein [Novosphingobium sp.]